MRRGGEQQEGQVDRSSWLLTPTRGVTQDQEEVTSLSGVIEEELGVRRPGRDLLSPVKVGN